MIQNYLKTAFRNLVNNRAYSFINIAGLSFGLACSMLIILYVKDEVSYERFHKNSAHVYQVVRRLANKDGSYFASDAYTGLPQGPQFAAAIPELNGFVRLQNGQKDIQKGNDVQSQSILYVDSNFFSVFTFPLLQGNPQTALLQPHSIVITEELARKQFGNADALNKIIMIKGD
jgi:putative ABC transport system permease protein